MTPEATRDGMSQIGVYVPTNTKEALYLLAHERSEPRDKTTMSGLARDYIMQGLARDVKDSQDVPGEIYDLLDDDLVANAGGEDA